jgi:hypothetical protein
MAAASTTTAKLRTKAICAMNVLEDPLKIVGISLIGSLNHL